MTGLRLPPLSPRPRIALRVRQRGSVLIASAAALLVSVILLGSADLGYRFYLKREFQKAVDLAALAGAQQVTDSCAAATTAATGNAGANIDLGQFKAAGGGTPLQVECGRWDPVNNAAPSYFVPATANLNAVRVTMLPMVPSLMPALFGTLQMQVQAVATQNPPVAAFSVGAQLLRVNSNAPLERVLQAVGVDTTKLTVLDSNGLAQVMVTPSGLLKALGLPVDASLDVASANALLAANKVSVSNLLDAAANLIAQNGAVGVTLDGVANALQVGLNITQLNIPLGSADGVGGLFAQITAPTTAAALNAQVSLADILKTSLGIATAGRAVQVPGLDLLGGVVKAQVGIVEPPSIGIGGVGAKAYNSQVRVFLDINTDNLLGGLVKSLLHLEIPLFVDVISGYGTLKDTDCDDTPKTATIDVTSSILEACTRTLGNPNLWSTTSDLCADTPAGSMAVKLLGLNFSIPDISLAALQDDQTLTIPVGQTASTDPNSLPLGTTVQNVVNALLNVLGNLTALPAGSNDNASVAAQVAKTYLAATADPATGRYDGTGVVALLQNGSAANNLGPIGDWQVADMVPYTCGLGLATCWKDGSVWTGYTSSVTGSGYGLVDSLLNILLGGLLVQNCSGLVSQLLTYNACVQNNLASYLQTKPGGLQNITGPGSVTDASTTSTTCSGLVCLLLQPALAILKPVLNGVGSLLSSLLANVLGLELGRTDVKVMSLTCNKPSLVY